MQVVSGIAIALLILSPLLFIIFGAVQGWPVILLPTFSAS
jgi:hypothetical protein